MSDIEAKLRLRADFAEAAKAFTSLRTAVREVTAEANGAGSGGQVPFRGMREGVRSISQQLSEAKVQLLALIGAQAGLAGIAGTARIVDEYAGLTARLRIVTGSQKEFNDALAATRSLARQYQAPLESTVALYTRMAAALKPLGGGAREAQVATEAMLSSLKVSGATTAGSASAILQFSQAMGAGTLRGEEFNSMLDAAPRLLDAIAAGLGKPRSELKSLAEQGQLTTSAVVGALTRELPKLQAEAAKMPQTIGGAVQGLRDRFSSLVGASAESSEGVRSVVGAIQALSDALPTVLKLLGTVAALLAAIKLGVLAEGLIAAGTAAATGAVGLGAFVAVLRGALGLIMGPVGWIVALGSLALAWVGLSKAQQQARDTSDAGLAAEKAAVDAEIEKRQKWLRENPLGTVDSAEQGAALLRLRQQRAALAEELETRREIARLAAKPVGGGSNTLQEPTTVKDFEDQYKSREAIVQKFELDRSKYILAKDKEIEAARLAGNAALEAKLTRAKQAALAQQQREEAEALKKFDADTTLSRLATYKEHYDRLADLAADATARALKANQDQFDDLLRSSQSYFDERAAQEEREAQQSLERLERELADKRKVLANNEAVLARARKNGTANDVQAAQEAVTQNRTDVERAQADIEKARRDAQDRTRQRQRDETAITREIQRQSAELVLQTKQLNDQVTAADLRAAAERRYADQKKRELAETGKSANADALIDAEARVAELALLQQRFAGFRDQVNQAEAEIEAAVARGEITSVEAEKAKFEARAKVVPQLEGILAALQAVAKTDAEKTAVARLRLDVRGLQDQTTELERTARDATSGGLSRMFVDIATRAKTAKEAALDFVASIGKSMLNLVAKRLGEQLTNSLFSSVGNLLPGLFTSSGSTSSVKLHSGGIVGLGGQAFTAPLAAFVGAPRYHSGGIAGLRPNEVPAILERGEEVLTRDDPRHARNAAALGGVSITVNVSGGSNDLDAQVAGQGLAAMVQTTVERWAVEQSREGGMLNRGRR